MPVFTKLPSCVISGSSAQYRDPENTADICSHGISLKAESEAREANTIRNIV